MAKRNTEAAISINNSHVKDFSDYWQDRGFHTSTLNSPKGAFAAAITYKAQQCTVHENTRASIQLSGFDGLTVIIFDTDVLTDEQFHLRQDPAFGTFRFNKSDGSLHIKNHSMKHVSDYAIIINPIGK